MAQQEVRNSLANLASKFISSLFPFVNTNLLSCTPSTDPLFCAVFLLTQVHIKGLELVQLKSVDCIVNVPLPF